MRYLIFSLLLMGCAHETSHLSTSIFDCHSRPMIVFQQIEDQVGTSISEKASLGLSQAIYKRLIQKQRLNFVQHKRDPKHFEISMQLLQQEEAILNPSELTMSVHLKIVDIRSDKPRIILQEILSISTLLEKPFLDLNQDDLQGEKYRVNPIGLAEAKLARDIATRIEDYVLLAQKGK